MTISLRNKKIFIFSCEYRTNKNNEINKLFVYTTKINRIEKWIHDDDVFFVTTEGTVLWGGNKIIIFVWYVCVIIGQFYFFDLYCLASTTKVLYLSTITMPVIVAQQLTEVQTIICWFLPWARANPRAWLFIFFIFLTRAFSTSYY